MSRKPVTEGGMREKIVETATELFLTLGYDGTSIRKIMNKAGGEVGLFYYYFKNKDDVFDSVLDYFFAGYASDFAAIVRNGRRNPCRVMQNFFEYIERETAKFRKQYADKMHRTVRWAIREHMLTLIEPYLEQIVEIQSYYYGVRPPIVPKVAALYLTHGVGSAILHEDSEIYFKNRVEIKHGISLLMGMSMEQQPLRIPEQATAQDISALMELVSSMQEHLPCFDEAEYEKQLARRIEHDEAWLFRNGAEITAALLFSREKRELDFLAVSPEYRRHGLAQKLVETAAAQLPVGAELSVVIYREGDAIGAEARAFFGALGFTIAEELTMFDSPCQRMTVTVPDAPMTTEKHKLN